MFFKRLLALRETRRRFRHDSNTSASQFVPSQERSCETLISGSSGRPECCCWCFIPTRPWSDAGGAPRTAVRPGGLCEGCGVSDRSQLARSTPQRGIINAHADRAPHLTAVTSARARVPPARTSCATNRPRLRQPRSFLSGCEWGVRFRMTGPLTAADGTRRRAPPMRNC